MEDLKSVFSNNLIKLMSEHNEGVKELAESIDTAYSTVSDWKLGKKMPRSGGLQKLANHYNLNITDLLSDNLSNKKTDISSSSFLNLKKRDKSTQLMHMYPSGGNPTDPININDIEKITKLEPHNYQVRVPILGTIACGEPIFAEQNIVGYRDLTFDHKPDGTLFILKCKGKSMLPIIPDGAFVTIRKQSTVENGEIAAVLIEDEATIKRVKFVDKDVFLIPENRDYQPIILTPENPGKIIGKVIHVDYDIK